ncbi:ClpV1 family T6SS ATPase [Planctomycetaceae bacterium SCGC AG-212-F19]|nr:ClpV1 family T6SS ATPase [Planctomycetaceae bacterium SCGC AG-212-F19]
MGVVNLKSLVGKLNATCRRALEGAAGMCMSRSNYNVEIEHWLLKLLETGNIDLNKVFKHYNVDPSRVSKDLTKTLDKLRTGNARAPELSLEITDLMRESWTLTSLDYGAGRVRSGYLLAALLADRNLGNRARSNVPDLAKIPAEQFQKDVTALIAGSSEDEQEVADASAGGGAAPSADGGQPVRPGSKTPSLDQFTMNLTERAKKGEIDPVIGRDFEIRQVIDILTRRRQNNPILTGEAGVGKTAVVEGFAIRVVAGDVPPPLKGVTIRTLDLGLLQAGAGVKGEFENRLKSVISEVKSSPVPIILFIDEAHTMIGAGGQAGQGDAANLLKPALARGELRTIAATTWMEYKKYFETDAALKRRFQVVKVDEPDPARCIRMMRGLAHSLEKHHGVRILDEAVEDAVKLSHRYIPDRQLPDKSVSLLDTSCARVNLSRTATPAALEDCQREIDHLDVEIAILTRETAVGASHKQRLDELNERKGIAEKRRDELLVKWEAEKKLVEEIQNIRLKMEAHLAAGTDATKAKDKLSDGDEKKSRDELVVKEKELKKVQGETPLVHPVVDGQSVAEVVSGWTGIPIGKMVLDEIKTVLNLQKTLEERIIGQSHALEVLAERIQTSRAGLTDPKRPIGVFMFVGPSGVGKTETAMALADILYGGDRNMVVINMSEYKEEHKISRLTGSAAGYVGYGEGGVLTEGVRRKPYCIVLLDEVEKSHPGIQEIFYQVFDKGVLQDDKGQDVDFKNTIILLTSNVGTDTIMKVCADPDTKPDAAGLNDALRPDLLKVFKPALLGRITIVPYYPLTDEVIRKIIQLQLKKVANRMKENHKATFTYDDALLAAIGSRCKEVESGARNADQIISGTLLPEMSIEILTRMAEGRTIEKVHASVDGEGKFVYQIT